tara:strand:+ start:302 stop:904 length:603 start_codon:yes stop_codon:yes gene_type:complete
MEKIKNIILNEGFRSVITNGIRSFTVENLASRLTMSKKTIYQYFPKKEILIKKIIIFSMEKMTLEFKNIIKNEPDPIIQFIKIIDSNNKLGRKLNLQKLTYLKSRYPDIWKLIEEHRRERKNIFFKIFKLSKEKGYLKDSLDPLVSANLFMNIINSTFQPEFMLDNNLTLEETITHLHEIMSNGFFNDLGIKKINEYRNK